MNRPEEVENVKIESMMLGIEDHGIMTCFLNLKGHCMGVGFGGYSFDSRSGEEANGYGIKFIRRILETMNVRNWEDLRGMHCRIRHTGLGGKVQAIGHIVEDKWFDPEELRSEFFGDDA
jgi:hypothetical protein